jgi:L-ribulose-5-phosphate 3-epimerase
MKLAFSLVLKDAESAIPARLVNMVRAAGFDGIEPTLTERGSWPEVADVPNTAALVRTHADRVGLSIPSMRGGPGFWSTFASSDPEKRLDAVVLAKSAMDALKIMGGDTLLIVPGQWEKDQSYSSVWRNALDTAKRIAEVAEKRGIKVALENVENRFLLSPLEWMKFLDEVESKFVRMYFDVGNVIYLGLGHPEEWIRELGTKYIKRIHFKDATRGQVNYLLEGEVNWSTVVDVMREVGYDDWVGIELPLPTQHPGAMLEATCRTARAILKRGEAS